MRIGSAIATDESGNESRSLVPWYDRVRSGLSMGQRKQYHRSWYMLAVAVRGVKVLRCWNEMSALNRCNKSAGSCSLR